MSTSVPEEPAPFDDCRAALTFALNAHRVAPPTAYMNKAMAEAKVELKRQRKSKKKKREPTEAEALLEAEKEAQQRRGGSLVRLRPPSLRGLDGAHMAGIILHHFGRLDREHQLVLMGLCTTAFLPCDCQRLCCSGWTPVERWLSAVRDVCDLVRSSGDVLGMAPVGKKGLSSQPRLREELVRMYFTKRDHSLVDLARIAKVSTVTVAKHREWIFAYLDQTETAAWQTLAPIFDTAGITGAHL